MNAQTLDYYKKLGYDAHMNKPISVKAEHLTPSSGKRVLVVCDYCGDVIEKTYMKYHKQRQILEKDACYKCFELKEKELCNIKYGVDCTLQIPSVKEKSKKTLQEKYGVENIMQDEDVLNKFKNTMLERYGVEFAQQSEEIRNKTVQSCIERFGIDNPLYLEQAKSNIEFVNGIKVSANQKKIAGLLNGALNTNINGYYADIVLINDNIIIEYNGSGHDLAVQLGRKDRNEFNQKEHDRLSLFNENGWKCLVIENSKEKHLRKSMMSDIENLVNSLREINIISTTYYNIS